jgi:aminodeoxyfutalosine deaminase
LKLILARQILPITSPPIHNGGLAIKSGRIVDVGTRKTILQKYPGSRVCDLGGAILMPGLVNAHTHVELSHLRGMVDFDGGFFKWIERLISLRGSVGDTEAKKAATTALRSAINSGTTCIGDISASDRAIGLVAKCGLRSRVYLEVIGLDAAKARRTFGNLKKRLKAFDMLPGRVYPGISPHSTYSVSGLLYKMLSKIISEYRLHIAVHLSENKDEAMHVTGRRSRIDDYHMMLGWDMHDKNRADSPLGYLFDRGITRRLLAVHAVHVSSADITRMAKEGVSVVHCPRSNHLLGVGRAPVSKMLKRGINVSIGTDSLASNMDLNLWEEMRFAYITGGLDPESVIKMATINGARALGLDEITGSLEPGKAADIIAIGPIGRERLDIYKHLLYNTRASNVLFNMVDGKILYRADGVAI